MTRQTSGSRRPPNRAVLALLLLASFTLITLDARSGDSSPLDPVRSAVGNVVGPFENGAAAAVRPFSVVPTFVRSRGELRADVARLKAQNSRLQGELAGAGIERNRVAELDGMLASAKGTGYALVPARVVAMGPAQSFSRTVTIDAGTTLRGAPGHDRAQQRRSRRPGAARRPVHRHRAAARRPGVGRRRPARVEHGGRLPARPRPGRRRGPPRPRPRRRLRQRHQGRRLVTWGSRNNAPYVPGIPIGRVTDVYSTPRQQSTQAVITPYVDFTSLDLVGVVADKDVKSDRTVIRADGTTREGGR